MTTGKFFIESIKDFRNTGSWMPSQKFLVNNLTKHVKNKNIDEIIEFGAGEGCVTKSIIKKTNKNSKIITFELNKKMCDLLKVKFKNETRLIIVNDDVKNANKYLTRDSADIIISSLPLGNMRKNDVIFLLKIAKETLKKDGLYIQYQYLGQDLFNVKKVFKDVKLRWQPLNFPPAFIYICKK